VRILRLEHLDLVVSDIKKSVEFYRKLGLYPEGTLDNGDSVYLINGEGGNRCEHCGCSTGGGTLLTVELHQAKKGQKTGVDHVSLEVEDVQTAYNELKYLGGIDFVIEPREIPRSGRTIFNFYDPDGVQIQLSRKTTRGEYEDWH